MSYPWLAARASPSALDKADLAAIERELNAGKDDVDQTRVTSAIHRGGGKVEVYRTETPNEARQRWMDAQGTDDNKNSFHSAIVSNPQHSRLVTAYDLAVGQAKAIDDPVYHLYLCLVADWRTDWDILKVRKSPELSAEEKKLYLAAMALRDKEGAPRKLIDETIEYRKTGKLPACAICDLPPLVISQTLADRENGKEPSTDALRKVAMDQAAAEQLARDTSVREANNQQVAADNAALNRLLHGRRA